jgi:hypothetical protein
MARTCKKRASSLACSTAAIGFAAMIYPLLAAGLGLSVGCSGGVDRMAVADADPRPTTILIASRPCLPLPRSTPLSPIGRCTNAMLVRTWSSASACPNG